MEGEKETRRRGRGSKNMTVQFQKIPILPPPLTEGTGISWGVSLL